MTGEEAFLFSLACSVIVGTNLWVLVNRWKDRREK